MKAKIRNLVYVILRFSGIPMLLRNFVQSRKPTVLLFHELPVEVSKSIFLFLKKKYSIIDASLLVKGLKQGDFNELPRKSMIITFDDGRRSNLKLDTSIIQAPIINFISSHSSRLDGAKFIGSDEINELANQFEIGGHTHTHPDLSTLSFEDNLEEIKHNRSIISNQLNTQIKYFAYPYGKYSTDSIDAVKLAGFTAAFTVNEGFVELEDGLFEIKRICLSNNPTVSEVAVKSSGFLAIVNRLNSKKSK